MSAPEEHQRQAMEVAQRAAVQSAHANTTFVPQPVQVQRQLSQVRCNVVLIDHYS